VDLPADANVSMAASNLKEDTEYFFNVALLAPSGLVTAYLGTVGTLNLNKVTVAAPASTTVFLIAGVGGVAVFLLVLVFLMRWRLGKQSQRKIRKAKEAKAARATIKEKVT
jgi:Na+-transporting methylmalonyl-CoA/oxaloacetate decarboxylase gamma subunit